MIRAVLLLSSYLTGVWIFLVMVCVLPGRSLALVSPQAYARVVAEAEWIAYQAAQRTATVSAVASAAAVESPAAVALRFVAGPVGWAALGVAAGAFLYQVYYSSQDAQALKQAALTPGWTVSSPTMSPSSFHVPMTAFGGQQAAVMTDPAWLDLCLQQQTAIQAQYVLGPFTASASTMNADPSASTWGTAISAGVGTYVCVPRTKQASVTQTGGAVTPQTIATHLGSLPASDPLSIESHTTAGGVGAQPTAAPTVQTTPASPTEMPTTVKPMTQVTPQDLVVATNVPPPAGTTTTTPTTQQSSTTVLTVTNPDGSQTQTKTTTGSASCTAPGGHEQRTLGTILAQHQAAWTSSGLLGALTLLKTLTWPTALPVVDLPSTIFGTQHVDFNQWAWAFTALRTLLIAVASLAAYRIIFVGG